MCLCNDTWWKRHYGWCTKTQVQKQSVLLCLIMVVHAKTRKARSRNQRLLAATYAWGCRCWSTWQLTSMLLKFKDSFDIPVDHLMGAPLSQITLIVLSYWDDVVVVSPIHGGVPVQRKLINVWKHQSHPHINVVVLIKWTLEVMNIIELKVNISWLMIWLILRVHSVIWMRCLVE